MGEAVWLSMKPLARRTRSYDIGASSYPMTMVVRGPRSYDIGAGTHPMAMVVCKTY